jgi:hypothetical protein
MSTTNFQLVITGSGLEPERQLEIRAAFEPFAEKVQAWATQIAAIADPKIARETRLAMRRERIDLEKRHEEFKSRTLAWTRAVDGSRRVISEAYDSMEAQMADIEKAEERRIAAAKAALKAERDAALRQYGVDVTYIQTGEMTDAAFLGLLEQSKLAHEAKLAAAAKAEADRIEREKREAEERAARAKAEAEERERMRVENEKLKAAAAEAAAREAEARKKAAEERAKIEAEAAAQRAKAEAEAAEERAKRAKLEREMREAQQKAAAEAAAREAEAKRLAAAPDLDKLKRYVADLQAVPKPELVSVHAQQILTTFRSEVGRTASILMLQISKLEGRA